MNKSLTVSLTQKEMEVFESLCLTQELSPDAMFRQMLRFYQLTMSRMAAGETMAFSGDIQRARDFMGPSVTDA